MNSQIQDSYNIFYAVSDTYKHAFSFPYIFIIARDIPKLVGSHEIIGETDALLYPCSVIPGISVSINQCIMMNSGSECCKVCIVGWCRVAHTSLAPCICVAEEVGHLDEVIWLHVRIIPQ
eukprot:TRINITY_DN8364_c0_g1_i1.p1 TRINITY_DN8364_c0_g1~~TRINITY_DN8364_c0_g1_i1.p1  ORF type:complete len:120 (+),score=8.23 TRINITY_DN8364_c0_g1_i1:78-437(+)